MIREHGCVRASLRIAGDPWSYPQGVGLEITGDPWAAAPAKSLGIIWNKSGDHLEQVWGSPMIHHQPRPTTTNNYPRGWLSNATHDRPCDLWMNSANRADAA